MGMLLPGFFGIYSLCLWKQIWSVSYFWLSFQCLCGDSVEVTHAAISFILASSVVVSPFVVSSILVSSVSVVIFLLYCSIFLVLELVINDGRLDFRVLFWAMSSYIDKNSSDSIWNFPYWADLKKFWIFTSMMYRTFVANRLYVRIRSQYLACFIIICRR